MKSRGRAWGVICMLFGVVACRSYGDPERVTRLGSGGANAGGERGAGGSHASEQGGDSGSEGGLGGASASPGPSSGAGGGQSRRADAGGGGAAGAPAMGQDAEAGIPDTGAGGAFACADAGSGPVLGCRLPQPTTRIGGPDGFKVAAYDPVSLVWYVDRNGDGYASGPGEVSRRGVFGGGGDVPLAFTVGPYNRGDEYDGCASPTVPAVIANFRRDSGQIYVDANNSGMWEGGVDFVFETNINDIVQQTEGVVVPMIAQAAVGENRCRSQIWFRLAPRDGSPVRWLRDEHYDGNLVEVPGLRGFGNASDEPTHVKAFTGGLDSVPTSRDPVTATWRVSTSVDSAESWFEYKWGDPTQVGFTSARADGFASTTYENQAEALDRDSNRSWSDGDDDLHFVGRGRAQRVLGFFVPVPGAPPPQLEPDDLGETDVTTTIGGANGFKVAAFDPYAAVWYVDRNGDGDATDAGEVSEPGAFGAEGDYPLAFTPGAFGRGDEYDHCSSNTLPDVIAIWRPRTGEVFVDANNSGKLDAGDLTLATSMKDGPNGKLVPVIAQQHVGDDRCRSQIWYRLVPTTGPPVKWFYDRYYDGTMVEIMALRGFGEPEDVPFHIDQPGVLSSRPAVWHAEDGVWRISPTVVSGGRPLLQVAWGNAGQHAFAAARSQAFASWIVGQNEEILDSNGTRVYEHPDAVHSVGSAASIRVLGFFAPLPP